MKEGGDIRLEKNFVVKVLRGRGRVIYKDCWWDVGELINYVVYNL